MSWATCMKFRRTAESVRKAGWANLAVTVVISMLNAQDGLSTFALGGVWAGAVMLLTYGLAWGIDRHADRVVGR